MAEAGTNPRALRVAAIQMASAAGDKEANLEKAARLIEAADADLAVLPELFATEFFATARDTRFFDYAEPANGEIVTRMAEVARRTGTMLVVPFFEYAASGEYYNSAALIDRTGKTLGVYRKTHIPFTRTFEKYYFAPGGALPVFDTPLGRIGILICYDRWFPEAWAKLREAGAEIVCVPIASWRFEGGSEAPFWEALHTMRARENLLFVAAANRTGRDGDFAYIGNSLLADPAGKLLERCDETFEGSVVADIDLDDVRRIRGAWPLLRDRRPDLY